MPIPKFITDRYTSVSSGAGPTQPSLDWGNIAKDLGAAAAIYGVVNPNDSSGLANFFGTGGQQQPVGYTGGIPNYTASRELAPNAFAQTYTTPTGEVAPRRPGSAGRRYFTDTQFTQDTATPFMGITAEQIAAQNQAALDEQALFESILGNVETEGAAARAAKAAAEQATTTPAATTPAATTPAATTPAATTPAATTPAATTDTAYTNFINQFAGRELTADDAAALAGSGYSLNQLATSFGVDPTELRTFVNFHTGGNTTTDDGLVGTTGMANTLVSLDDTTVTDDIVNTLTLNAADGNTSTIDLTKGTTPLTTTGSATLADGPLAPTFDMVDASDGLSKKEQDIIYSVMNISGANIADVAEEFNTTQDDVIEGLLRGGYETPEQIAATLNAVDPDIEFTEAQLIANLLEGGRTTPEEVAAYYKDHPVYGGITPEQVKAAFKDLGGTRQFAQGGNVNGYYLGGPTDGMADQIPATIDNMQPAALSDGEFVIPADVVSHLGNGNSDAGAKNLYSMMERVRTDRTGNPKQGKQIDPNKYLA